jgi:chaperone modulatory protein CbpM
MDVRVSSRTPLDVSVGGAADGWLSVAELARAAGISPAMIDRLIRLGVLAPAAVEPRTTGDTTRVVAVGATGHRRAVFAAVAVIRLRRMLRLHRDLGVNFTGAAVIVDLVERLDQLEKQLARPRSSDKENA